MPTPTAAALHLTRIVAWAHELLAPALHSGDLAVDLTAGRGRDTLFLFHQVGPTGRVLSFDVQPAALLQTETLLTTAGAVVHWHDSVRAPDCSAPGVHLLGVGHERLSDYLDAPPRAVIANLGYLPGGPHEIATAAETTRKALDHAYASLVPGGRLAVVAYPGHAGGAAEAAMVEAFFARLPVAAWLTLRLTLPNAPDGPLLLVAQKQ